MTQIDADRSTRSTDGGGSKKLTFVTAVLALLTAGFGVLSAYLGVQTAQLGKEQKEAEVAAQSASAQASSLQGENQQLEQGNEQLQRENADLRSQLGAPSASNIPSAGPTERHKGKVVVASNGPDADLDAPKSDTQWGTSGATSSSEIEYNSGTTLHLGYYGGQNLDLGDTPATYDSCTTSLGYASGVDKKFDVGNLQPGQYFCVKTDEHRYAALKLLSVDESQVTFDVVTYDPPFA